jgi:hypothetical protein
MAGLRNFSPADRWVGEDGRLTDRALGFLRELFDFLGARNGVIPIDTIGGDGVSTDAFLREDGVFSVPEYPEGADPTASVGLSATNGTAVTFMRSDAGPSLNQAIVPTWTGLHTFTNGIQTTSLVASTTLRSTGGFGCNGATPQVAAAVSGAIAGTAGAAYTATEQGLINSLITQVTQLRALLIANGQAV